MATCEGKRGREKVNTYTREIRGMGDGAAARFVICLPSESKGESEEKRESGLQ